MPEISCDTCRSHREAKASKNGVRLPMGWKRHQGKTWCDKCWRSAYRLRAVTFPVVGPLDAEWSDLRAALSLAWGDSTRLANWIMRELYARDVRREPGVEKMPKRPRTYLYPETGAVAPHVAAQSRSAMEQAITGKYSAARYKVIWTGEAQLPTFRYPYPYPVSNQGWSAEWLTDDEGGNRRPVVSANFAGRRWRLQLRGGHEFRRQLGAFAQIVSGEACKGELAMYRVKANGGDHRNGGQERDTGGQHAQTRVMVKLVAWIPKHQARDASGTLFVRTDGDSLLVALDVDNERLWVHHADHVRRWVAEHERKLGRWSDDQKAEQRPTASYQSKRERSVEKYRNRMDSAVKEAASQLVSFAKRRRLATIQYRDDDQTFVSRFPYFAMRNRIAAKCEDEGIEFVYASGAEEKKAP